MGCHALLQGIFLTQRSNPGPPALEIDSLLNESPGKLEQATKTPACDTGPAAHVRREMGQPCTRDTQAHLPGYEVIEGQPQDREEQEHGDGPAVPHSVHVHLREREEQTGRSGDRPGSTCGSGSRRGGRVTGQAPPRSRLKAGHGFSPRPLPPQKHCRGGVSGHREPTGQPQAAPNSNSLVLTTPQSCLAQQAGSLWETLGWGARPPTPRGGQLPYPQGAQPPPLREHSPHP